MSKKVVPSILYTTEAEKLSEEIRKELKVPDPDVESAEAAISKASQEDEDAKKG